MVDVPELLERQAIRLLTGVGNDREWWHWNPDAHVGHLRVGTTEEEVARMPPGCALHDAGDTGPERVRSTP